MAEFNNLRIQLLTHTRKQWNEQYSNYVVKQGEVCVALLNAQESTALGGVGALTKIGDGVHTYGELEYTGANAANVSAWARKDAPEYSDFQGQFIADLDEHLDSVIAESLNGYATEEWVEDKNYLTEHQDISSLATKAEVTSGLAAKQDKISSTNKLSYNFIDEKPDLSVYSESVNTAYSLKMTISDDYVVTAQLYRKDGSPIGAPQQIDLPLESVVVSGHYDDTTRCIILVLDNGDIITVPIAHLISGLVNETQLQNILLDYQLKAELARVAKTASYNDLVDTPYIPEKVSDLTNDLKFVQKDNLEAEYDSSLEVDAKLSQYDKTTVVDEKLGELEDFTREQIDNVKEIKASKSELAAVAFSGKFTDLVDEPTKVSLFENDAQYLVPSDIANLATKGEVAAVSTEVAKKQNIIDATNKLPYEYVEDTPYIPVKTSDLTNDSDFITSAYHDSQKANDADLATVAKSGSYNDLTDKPSIPSIEGLATQTYVNSGLATKQDALTKGLGILITNNVISVDDCEISSVEYVDANVNTKQDKLTAGTGINIDEENNISCTIKGIPEMPDGAEDGTYVLTASVVSGVVTLTWELKS